MTPGPRWLTYIEIAEDIAARIDPGEYPPGSRLPSHRELAALYSVTTATIERAQIAFRR